VGLDERERRHVSDAAVEDACKGIEGRRWILLCDRDRSVRVADDGGSRTARGENRERCPRRVG
jgi:hypothetical protein